MDCGSGLLLLLTRTIRQIEVGEVLLMHTEEPSVPPDLHDWARLAGHHIVASVAERPDGPWHVTIRRGTPLGTDPSRPLPGAASVFSTAAPTPVGHRLWLYSNFHCNLACDYCCAESSPHTDPQLLPLPVALAAADEFVALDGRELFVTGGEPFLHPDIEALITQLATRLPVTVLTNAMTLLHGSRAHALQAMPHDRVTLQVSLDSAAPTLHDRHRGPGSHAKALAGIAHARQLGFTVKVAATLSDTETGTDAGGAADLHALLDTLNIASTERLIRPVAQQGFADHGHRVTLDTLQPEPTLTANGIWWHPVAVTDPTMQVATTPLPVAAALDTIRDTLATQDAARSQGRRHVFRCA